jgi:GNAT superfamily N-acetyltransferase
MVLEGEDEPDVGWFAVFVDGRVVGTVGVMPEPRPGGSVAGWRLRAMATAPQVRGTGLGRQLLDAAVSHVITMGGDSVWASVRIPARGFYERAGFVVISDVYEPPHIGPHVKMETRVSSPES